MQWITELYILNRWLRQIIFFISLIIGLNIIWIPLLAYICAGAAAVEGFGSQFLKMVDGSHSCIIGLPLYEAAGGICTAWIFSAVLAQL